MDDRILKERLDALDLTLRGVLKPEDWKGDFEKVNLVDGAWGALQDNIGGAAKNLRTDIETIRQCADIQKAWADYRDVRARSQQLFRECIELLGGLAFRDRELDFNICRIADELIQNCAAVTREEPSVTVPAAQEAFSRTMGRIIRLRFPEWTVWTLPFTAHEFSHVVLEKQMKQVPGLRTRLGNVLHSKDRTRLPGLVADALATYMMGPAYACAAIYLRLDPSVAYVPDDLHPCADTRVRVIVSVLERMNAGPSWEAVFNRLKETWQHMLDRVQPAGEASSKPDQIKQFVDNVWQNLFENKEHGLPSGARYNKGWRIAEEWNNQWADQLKKYKQLTPTVKEQRQKERPAGQLRDVLNAAWLCRLWNNEEDVPEYRIAEAATKLSELIMNPTETGRKDKESPWTQTTKDRI